MINPFIPRPKRRYANASLSLPFFQCKRRYRIIMLLCSDMSTIVVVDRHEDGVLWFRKDIFDFMMMWTRARFQLNSFG
jgi:hypothetical protein